MDDEQIPARGGPGPQTYAGDEEWVAASPPPLVGSKHGAVGESSVCGPQLGVARSTPGAEFSSPLSSPPSSPLSSLPETPSPPSGAGVQVKGKGRASATTARELSSLPTSPLPQSSLHPTSPLPTARLLQSSPHPSKSLPRTPLPRSSLHSTSSLPTTRILQSHPHPSKSLTRTPLPRSSPHRSSASSSTVKSGKQASKPRGRGRKRKGKARARKDSSSPAVIPGRKDLKTDPRPSASQPGTEPRKIKRKRATVKEPPLESGTPLAGPSSAVYDIDAMGPRWGRWVAPLPLRKDVAPRVLDADEVAAAKARKEMEDVLTRGLAGGGFAPASSKKTEAALQVQSVATGRVPTINDLIGRDFGQPYWPPNKEVSAEWKAEQDPWYERIKATRRVPTINDLMRPDFVQPYRPSMTWEEASVEWRAQETEKRAAELAAATTEEGSVAETPAVAENSNPVPSSVASSSMDKTRATIDPTIGGSGGTGDAPAGDVSRNPGERSTAAAHPYSDATATTPAKRSWEIVGLTGGSHQEASQPHKRQRASPKCPTASSSRPEVRPKHRLPHGGGNAERESQPETTTEPKTEDGS